MFDWTRRWKRTHGGGLVAFGGLWLSMLAGVAQGQEADGWTGGINVGVTAQSGTTDTFSGSIDANADRAWAKDEVSVRFSGVYGTSRTRDKDGTETIQNAQALFGDWKHLFSDRFFWDTGSELSRDNTQDRELRVRVNTGPGYRFWKGDAWGEDAANSDHFDISAGVGYRYEIYDGNTNGGTGTGVAENGDKDHFADLVAGFDYANLMFDGRIEFTHTGSAFVPANDFEAYLLRTEIIFGVPLSEAWSFRTGVLVEYFNDAPDDTNKLTTRTTVGLGYKF